MSVFLTRICHKSPFIKKECTKTETTVVLILKSTHTLITNSILRNEKRNALMKYIPLYLLYICYSDGIHPSSCLNTLATVTCAASFFVS